ncbi:hypothetical protein SK128_017744, partial [Halocaridina rubra]
LYLLTMPFLMAKFRILLKWPPPRLTSSNCTSSRQQQLLLLQTIPLTTILIT